MLKLAKESLSNVGGNVAAAGSFADLGGEPPRDGGRQLLGTGRLAHAVIIPAVGSDNSGLSTEHSPVQGSDYYTPGACDGQRKRDDLVVVDSHFVPGTDS